MLWGRFYEYFSKKMLVKTDGNAAASEADGFDSFRDRYMVGTGYRYGNWGGGPAWLCRSWFAPCVSISLPYFYAEFFASSLANGGALQPYLRCFREFPAWLAGWLTIMEFMTAISGVASGWGSTWKGFWAAISSYRQPWMGNIQSKSRGLGVDLLPILGFGLWQVVL